MWSSAVQVEERVERSEREGSSRGNQKTCCDGFSRGVVDGVWECVPEKAVRERT